MTGRKHLHAVDVLLGKTSTNISLLMKIVPVGYCRIFWRETISVRCEFIRYHFLPSTTLYQYINNKSHRILSFIKNYARYERGGFIRGN